MDGELRGLVLNLLAEYVKRTGDFNRALTLVDEALALMESAETRIRALTNAMDLCVALWRVAEALEYGKAIERLLPAVPPDVALSGEASYRYNLGVIMAGLGNDADAIREFSRAAELYDLIGNQNARWMSLAAIAERYVAQRQYAEAEKICLAALANATSNYVLVKVNAVLSAIRALTGATDEAAWYWDKAAALSAACARREDLRMMIELAVTEAAIYEAKGDTAGADALRNFARKYASRARLTNMNMVERW